MRLRGGTVTWVRSHSLAVVTTNFALFHRGVIDGLILQRARTVVELLPSRELLILLDSQETV